MALYIFQSKSAYNIACWIISNPITPTILIYRYYFFMIKIYLPYLMFFIIVGHTRGLIITSLQHTFHTGIYNIFTKATAIATEAQHQYHVPIFIDWTCNFIEYQANGFMSNTNLSLLLWWMTLYISFFIFL
jgi:hypothetical protein